ncbi:flagellar biosynthetic protein FliO [Peribacillus sp. SCS-37]|uniref:flagellar biosynthetic protein FliO n=1 Tax=Paraperibacillus esterisolvens TaxID=3115296 RepID=UPI003905ECEB
MLLKKTLRILLLLSIAFFGVSAGADAKQVDKSVKDWYEHPDKQEVNGNKSPAGTAKNDTNSTALSFSDFFRMAMATIFVVALLYIVLRFLKKKNSTFQKAGVLENLGGTSLGGSRSIQLIKVGDRILVVGVGETIQLLREIDDRDEMNSFLEQHNQSLDGMLQPADLITKLLNRNKAQTSEKSFATQLKNQLDEVLSSRKKAMNGAKERGEKDE